MPSLYEARFLAIFDLPTYLVLLYNVPFGGLSWTPLPTLTWDVINERSLTLFQQGGQMPATLLTAPPYIFGRSLGI